MGTPGFGSGGGPDGGRPPVPGSGLDPGGDGGEDEGPLGAEALPPDVGALRSHGNSGVQMMGRGPRWVGVSSAVHAVESAKHKTYLHPRRIAGLELITQAPKNCRAARGSRR